jgi:flagellar basal body-associated protein FliL
MTDNQNSPPKVEENQNPPAAPPPDDGLLSLDNLDALINESDPSFNKDLEQIANSSGAKDINIELIDLDAILAEEEARSLKARIKRFRKHITNWFIVFASQLKTNLIYFFKEGLPIFLKNSKVKIKTFFENINEGLRQFSFWPLKKKLATFGLIAGIGLTVAYIYIAFKNEIVSSKTELFVTSLENWADEVVAYDPISESEPFYDSARASQNMMVLPKMVVNLRRSAKSGPNPMGAFEFFIEGNSPDVMVEIKDREYEVRDLFQRNIEEFSFDQVDSNDGKQLLSEKLRREVNRILTKGRVRKIFFKTAILKP